MPVYSLSDLNIHIRQTLDDAYPEAIWIKAEIAGYNLNSFSGHCYLELIDGPGQSAKAKAMIWKKTFEVLQSKFRVQTGSKLEKGMQVQLLVKVEFNVQYGLSLIVWDIDAGFTIGDLAVKKAEVIHKLKTEGIFHQNHSKIPGFPCQKIAIISSPTSAGYGDFMNHLQENEFGYDFQSTLFAAQMQGKEAGTSISKVFEEINKIYTEFDVVVLIRGGGSNLDLQAFDEYEMAKAICLCALPVFTGIGHERDESVCDQTANEHFKTPTAVAQNLIDRLQEAESNVSLLIQNLSQNLSWALRKQEQEFEIVMNRMYKTGSQRIQKVQKNLDSAVHSCIRTVEKKLLQQAAEIELVQTKIQIANPSHILKLGYARVFQEGKWKKSKTEISIQQSILLQLQDGTLKAQPIQ